MSDEFLDSNIFVYLFDETDAVKRGIAEEMVRVALDGGTGIISFQVVQETLNVVTRKLKKPMSPEEARDFLEQVMTPLWHIMPTQRLYQRGLAIQSRYHYRFYDALIIAAALESGCRRLWSEDLQSGQQIEGLTIKNPFKT